MRGHRVRPSLHAGFMKHGILWMLALALAPCLRAQPATLRGFVTASATGEALEGVNVALLDARGDIYGSATTGDGLYVIAGLPAGRVVLQVSHIGYAAYRDTLLFEPGQVRTLDVALAAVSAELQELVVEAGRQARATNLAAGLQTVRPQDIERVPGPDVSGDLAAYLTLLPGVVLVGDQGGQFYIRGGEPTQNLALLDGILIYQPFHILSYYSAFPSEVLRSADLYAGGFGARYGGRISGVIDAWSRAGSNRDFGGSLSASAFVLGTQIEGPLGPRGGYSFLASGRQSVLESGSALLPGRDVPLNFSDVFLKLQGKTHRHGMLSITALHTYDRGRIGEDTGRGTPEMIRWTNDAVGARYLFLPGSLPVLAEFLFSGSYYENAYGPPGNPLRTSSTARINMETHVTHYSPYADVKWGLFARTLALQSELGGLFQQLTQDREYLTEAGIYAAPEFRLSQRTTLIPGLRIHNFPSKRHVYVEPRLRATWGRGPHQVNAAVGLYHQEITGISDRRDAANTFTAWTAVPEGDVPEAFHALLGYQRSFRQRMDFAVEAYYKRLSDLFVSEWTARPRFTTRLQRANGRVYGVDLRVETDTRHLYGYLNYGLSWVSYEAFQESFLLWFGREWYRHRAAHDRRHQVNFLVGTRIRGVDLNLRWQFGSGRPYNRAYGFDGFLLMDGSADLFNDPGEQRVIYESPFNGVLPAYHRLDLSLERTFDFASGDVTAQLSVINAYDRANIFYLDIFTLQRADQLPLIPSLGLRASLN